MTVRGAGRERFQVVCADWRGGNFASREAAEKAAQEIERAGHCPLDHRVEPKSPQPSSTSTR